MQRRPSKRRSQHAPSLSAGSPQVDTIDIRKIEGRKNCVAPRFYYSIFFCIFLFLGAVVLFVRIYYLAHNDVNLLQDYFLTSPKILRIDNHMSENGQLRPDDHIYREATTRTLNWSVTAAFLRPDGVNKKVYLVNDFFPGPTIEARSGDTLQILVRNNLEEEEISLHWHGLNMKNANVMDGVIGVTQCGIQPGESFWYNFTVSESQSGTFWYHSHSSEQRGYGLYGGLIVHRPVSVSSPNVRGLMAKHDSIDEILDDESLEDRGTTKVSDSVIYSYEKELLLLIGDWYHRPAQDVASWYLWWGSRGYEPVPDSLLINGVGHFNCSRSVSARPVNCIDLPSERLALVLERHSSYRVRVVNTGSLTGITLSFSKHKLDVITLDGGIPVEREPDADEKASAGILYPGQRMDFILRATKAKIEPSFMTVELDETDFKIGNPALETQQSFPIFTSPVSSYILPPTAQHEIEAISNHMNLDTLVSSRAILAALSPKAEQTHLVYAKVEKLSRLQNIPHGFFNRTTWKKQREPAYPLLGLARSQWDKHQLSITTGDKPVWVDLIVNNLDEGAHPFHFHGHNFFIIAMGQSADGSTWGSYNPWKTFSPPSPSTSSSSAEVYDLQKAVLRDTVQIPRRGYAVLRFYADNPGVWMFHCHVLWHLAGGMAMLVDSMSENNDAAHFPWLGEGSECVI